MFASKGAEEVPREGRRYTGDNEGLTWTIRRLLVELTWTYNKNTVDFLKADS
jgi:hypothetical protein